MKKLLLILGSSLLLAACNPFNSEPIPISTPAPINETPPDNSQIEPDGSIKCGIENCHGFAVECGPNIAEMCTMEYVIGDFCREYAECAVQEGTCLLVENEIFTECQSCVNDCTIINDIEGQFECEDECRTKIKAME